MEYGPPKQNFKNSLLSPSEISPSGSENLGFPPSGFQNFPKFQKSLSPLCMFRIIEPIGMTRSTEIN